MAHSSRSRGRREFLNDTNSTNITNRLAPSAGVCVLAEQGVGTNEALAPSPTQDATHTNPGSGLLPTQSVLDIMGEVDTGRESIKEPASESPFYHIRVDLFDNGSDAQGSRFKANIHINTQRGRDFTVYTCAFHNRARDFRNTLPEPLKSQQFYMDFQQIIRDTASVVDEEGRAVDWEIAPTGGKLKEHRKARDFKKQAPIIHNTAVMLSRFKGGNPVVLLRIDDFEEYITIENPSKGTQRCSSLMGYGEYRRPGTEHDGEDTVSPRSFMDTLR